MLNNLLQPPAREIHLHIIYIEVMHPPSTFTYCTCLKQVLLDNLHICYAFGQPTTIHCTPLGRQMSVPEWGTGESMSPGERKPKMWKELGRGRGNVALSAVILWTLLH